MIIEAREDVVKLEGTLDKNLWPMIQAAANLLLRHHVQGIIIDGGELTQCSPEGAKTFRDAMDYIENYRARIVVCDLSPDVMEAIRAVPGIRSRLPVAASVEEARASLNLARPGKAQSGGGRPLQDILVPLLETDNARVATTLAGRLVRAEGQKARVHLSYVLEVPRNLPLTAPLPQEEEAARALEAAQQEMRHEGVNVVAHVLRARDAGEEIVHQAAQLRVNIIVLSYQRSEDPLDELMSRVIKTVLDRAHCEVILNKVPV